MKMKETKINKSSWPRGEWDNEPDLLKFTYLGYKCQILRMADTGHLNGYVGITKTHPFVNKSQSSQIVMELSIESLIAVHGGITFADRIGTDKNIWWFGFDCAHSGDGMPGMPLPSYNKDKTYRNLEYVKNEVKSLAKQLKAFEQEKVAGLIKSSLQLESLAEKSKVGKLIERYNKITKRAKDVLLKIREKNTN
jgi:hypothetical protein